MFYSISAVLLIIFPLITKRIQCENVKTFNFDLVNYRITWVKTQCLFPGNYSCEIDENVNSWTIHGLWPSNSDGNHPAYCDRSILFNTKSLDYIKPVLRKYWPNTYKNFSEDSFWKHEWDKHGTCSIGLPDICSHNDYFTKSLELFKQMNAGKSLASKGIIPDENRLYNLSDIRESLKAYTPKNSFLFCLVPKDRSKPQYFYEIQYCHDLKFNPVDCFLQPKGNKNRKSVGEFGFNFTIQGDVESPTLGKYTMGFCDENLPVIYPPIK